MRRSADEKTLRADAVAYVAPTRAPKRTISALRVANVPRRIALEIFAAPPRFLIR